METRRQAPGVIFEPEPGERPGAPPTLVVPKPALIMAGALVTLVISLAVAAKQFEVGAFRERPTEVLVKRSLRFEDAPNQGIGVIDAATGKILKTKLREQFRDYKLPGA